MAFVILSSFYFRANAMNKAQHGGPPVILKPELLAELKSSGRSVEELTSRSTMYSVHHSLCTPFIMYTIHSVHHTLCTSCILYTIHYV